MKRFVMSALALVAVVGIVWGATAQTDLDERLRRLVRSGEYELARDLIDDHQQRGVEISAEARWLRAQLETDPDRFDRRALELASGTDPGLDSRAITLARAREQFARGRYQTAAELLRPLTAPGEPQQDGQVLLWLGMSEQASGQPGAATRALRAIQPTMPTYGMARALLSDLAFRAGRVEDAADEAERALETNGDAGAIALSVLERVARQRGDDESADDYARRLREEYPASAEAGWSREVATPAPARGADFPTVDVTDGREGFALQFGAFRDRSLALRLAERVDDSVDEVRIELDRSDGDPLYRVVGGRFLTRTQAETEQRRLQGDGWQALVLAPARGGR